MGKKLFPLSFRTLTSLSPLISLRRAHVLHSMDTVSPATGTAATHDFRELAKMGGWNAQIAYSYWGGNGIANYAGIVKKDLDSTVLSAPE